MTFFIRYWKPIAAVLLCALCFGWGYKTAALAGKYALASQLNAQADAYRKTIEQWQARSYKADEALAKAQAAIPQTGTKVDHATRAHPTSPACVAPDAVADELQNGVDGGKAVTAP